MKLTLTNLFLLSILFFYVNFQGNLKTKTYLCIEDHKITYWSKQKPKSPFVGECFYTEGYTNAQYSKSKNLLSKQP